MIQPLIIFGLSLIAGIVIGAVFTYQRVNTEYYSARAEMKRACEARITDLRATFDTTILALKSNIEHHALNGRAWYEYAERVETDNNHLRAYITRTRTGDVNDYEEHAATLQEQFMSMMRARVARPLMNTDTDNYVTGQYHPHDDTGAPVFDEPDGVTVNPDGTTEYVPSGGHDPHKYDEDVPDSPITPTSLPAVVSDESDLAPYDQDAEDPA